ncbi:hypothetical protein [Caldivirga sp.]|uniref:hypothetical protein n=1 Tax=Caldivirga sp. TaxID=2080243 RepID=UPI003D11FD83
MRRLGEGYVDVVRLLLEQRANPNQDTSGLTPLQHVFRSMDSNPSYSALHRRDFSVVVRLLFRQL